MEKDKYVIWNNDSLAHDGYEEGIKEEWIQEVQAKLGLCEPNDLWIPSGLVDSVKEAAIDDAIAQAMDDHEETINFVEAYHEFANEENIGAIIDEQFEDDLAEQADINVRDWLDNEMRNLSHIDVRDAIPFIRDDDGYCVLDGYRNYYPIGSIDNAGDLLEALCRKMSGDTIELSVKGGELVSSEPVGYFGEMEDHIVKLVDKNFVNEIERLVDEELVKLYCDNGFNKNESLDDVIVALRRSKAICKTSYLQFARSMAGRSAMRNRRRPASRSMRSAMRKALRQSSIMRIAGMSSESRSVGRDFCLTVCFCLDAVLRGAL